MKRRLRQYGLSVSASYAVITDEDLDQIVAAIVNDLPNCDYERMTGFLLARGLCVQQERIRESMRPVDLEGVLLRVLQLKSGGL